MRPTTSKNFRLAMNSMREQTIVDDLMASASTALDLAMTMAPMIPVPFVASIFGSAKVIVEVAQVSDARKYSALKEC